MGICDSLGINSIAIQSISWSSLPQRALICANEFAMADEVFALSPISARAALPSEQDYDAIREAFMETSRGRWFLGEYAKRNRNADTAMVLDAVARIEQAMAAQKQEQSRNDRLLEALAAVRGAVEEAAAKASTALTDLELDRKLAPIHKGARIIKEISWRWREIGADGRICDLIDSQLTAIEASCTEIAEADGSAALDTAFNLLRHKLDQLAEGNEAAAKSNGKANGKVPTEADITAAEEAAVAQAAAPTPAPAATQTPEAKAPATDEAPVETGFTEPEQPSEPAVPEAAIIEPIVVEPEAKPFEAAAAMEVEPEAMSVQAAEAQDLSQVLADELAHDEAVLEMVAMEMAAPDDSFDDFLPEETAEPHTTLPPLVEPVVASAPELASAPRREVAPPPSPRPEFVSPSPQPQFLPERAPSVAPEPSLGSTLIASGILQRPKPPSDPLAPIRRMSQAEKIALFS
jgi:hypothetical protein